MPPCIPSLLPTLILLYFIIGVIFIDEDTNLLFPPILYKYVNTEDNFRIVTEGSANQTIVLTVTFTYCNGAVDDQTIVIQQP